MREFEMTLTNLMRVSRVMERPVTTRTPSDKALINSVDSWVANTDLEEWFQTFYEENMLETATKLEELVTQLEVNLETIKPPKPPIDMMVVNEVTDYLFTLSAQMVQWRGSLEGVSVYLDQCQRRESWLTKTAGSVVSTASEKADSFMRLAINRHPIHLLIEDLGRLVSAAQDRLKSLSESYEVVSRRITLELETREEPARGRK